MLKKVLAATVLVVLFNALAFSFQADLPWEKFNSPEGKFNILLPSKPKLEVSEVDSKVGKLTEYSYSLVSSKGYFQVTYADYPVEPASPNQAEAVLDGARDGVMESIAAEVLSQKSISVNGYPGREFTARKKVGDSKVVFNWRIVLAGRRLYQVAVATPEQDPASPEAAKVLASFEINK